MPTIRPASAVDLEAICAIDLHTQQDAGHRASMERWIEARACFVAVDSERIVDRDHRRRSIGDS